MSTYDFNALMQQAQAEGFGPREVLDTGTYLIQAKTSKVSKTQGGKDQLGVRWVVIEGPLAGRDFWENQTISPDSPKAMGMFFRWCAKFGMDQAFWQRQPQPSLAEVASIIQDVVLLAEVGQRTWGKNNDKTDNTVKVIENRGKGGAAPAASVPASAPVVPAAAPAPVPALVPAPVPQAAPEPVPAVAPAPLPAPAAEYPVQAPVTSVESNAAPAALPEMPAQVRSF